jgi:beta-galactosidase
MVQAENEFGSYVAQRKDIPLEEHRKYSHKIKDMLLKGGISVPLFTSDGSSVFKGGSIEGALPTANGESDIDVLRKSINEYNGGRDHIWWLNIIRDGWIIGQNLL